MTRKPFDASLYAEHNAIAVMAGLNYLSSCGRDAIQENDDKYGVDLLHSKGSLEVEVKLSWKGGRFPFAEINVPYRKLKYFGTPGCEFLMLAANRKDFLVISGASIMQCAVEEQSNKYVASGEQFFKVPVTLAKFASFIEPIELSSYCCAKPQLHKADQSGNLLYICRSPVDNAKECNTLWEKA